MLVEAALLFHCRAVYDYVFVCEDPVAMQVCSKTEADIKSFHMMDSNVSTEVRPEGRPVCYNCKISAVSRFPAIVNN